MFSRASVEIVAALGIMRRLSKPAHERKSDGREAVGDFSSSESRARFPLHEKLLETVPYLACSAKCWTVSNSRCRNAGFFGTFRLRLATFLNLADLSDFMNTHPISHTTHMCT
ncbi:hypothetical protein ISCGN_013183 [Ixodes scapularis]